MQRRFVDTFQLYTDSVVQQAIDRDASYIPGVEHYLELRRETIGATPSFAILQLKLDIPDDVISHTAIETLVTATTDMISIGNDLWSYNVE